jgi:hypothetical protein
MSVRWTVCRSLKHGTPGWRVRGRSAEQPYLTLWFKAERDARAMQAALDAGLTMDAAFAQLHAQATRPEGPL